jgi:hypothetical protein
MKERRMKEVERDMTPKLVGEPYLRYYTELEFQREFY